MSRPMIAVEEHFVHAAELINDGRPENPYTPQIKMIPGLQERLLDVGATRLADMDPSNCIAQIVSHAPVIPTLDLAGSKAANDALAAHIKKTPKRFGGFAALPVDQPEACAEELTRAVRELGLVGALIDSHTSDGIYYEGAAYRPLFRAAQELDVPVYLHPTFPTSEVKKAHFSDLPPVAARWIAGGTFGWHADVTIHVLRLYAAGVFDELPKLKIMIGHMGEMIPYMLERMVKTSSRWGLKRSFADVWKENIWISTSGNWSVAPMACILRNTPIDHIILSYDYPFGTCASGRDLLDELESSGLCNSEQLDALAYGNAQKLLKVKFVPDS